MTCPRCSGSQQILESLGDPCATLDWVWCPDCADPPPPFRPAARGFWWARWLVATPETRDGGELTPADGFEPVEVVVNGYDPAAPDYLRVQVTGVERWQALDGFEWGPEIVRPAFLQNRAAA